MAHPDIDYSELTRLVQQSRKEAADATAAKAFLDEAQAAFDECDNALAELRSRLDTALNVFAKEFKEHELAIAAIEELIRGDESE